MPPRKKQKTKTKPNASNVDEDPLFEDESPRRHSPRRSKASTTAPSSSNNHDDGGTEEEARRLSPR
eukprot:scaffold335871_cov149-Cyclotella_meneghiniana.AAC.1